MKTNKTIITSSFSTYAPNQSTPAAASPGPATACTIGRVHLGARSDQLLDHFGLAVPSRCMQRRLASLQGVAVRDVREVWLGEIQKSKGVSGCLGWMLKNLNTQKIKDERDQCKTTCVLFSCLTKSWAWRSQDYASPALGLRYTFGVSKWTISHSHVCLSLIFGIISLNDCNPTKFASAPSSKHHIILLPPVSNKNTTHHSQKQLRLAKFACHLESARVRHKGNSV